MNRVFEPDESLSELPWPPVLRGINSTDSFHFVLFVGSNLEFEWDGCGEQCSPPERTEGVHR